MSKISERLADYQMQMSIYAEQHQLILASDVLDMIEQLQDDLKDSVEAMEKEMEQFKTPVYCNALEEEVEVINLERAKKIVRKGGKKED